MRITLQEIAKRAGVSRGTVDRALNHRGRINPDVADRILKIADQLGYVPRNHSSKKKKSTTLIGVITFLATRDFSTKIRNGLSQASEELKNWDIEVIQINQDSLNEAAQLAAIDEITGYNISGLVIMPIDSEKIREKLNTVSESRHIPVITLNSDIIGTKRISYIGIDNRQSGRAASALMAMLTRSSGSILVITGHLTNHTNNMRVDGFLETVKNEYPGLTIAGVQCCYDDAREMNSIITSSLKENDKINGIFVVSAGQDGIKAAFSDLGLKKRPYVIAYDSTECTKQMLQDGTIDFVIDQHCFNQGYRALYCMAYFLTGSTEAFKKSCVYMDINIKTKFNI